jgi:hypothetical protein
MEDTERESPPPTFQILPQNRASRIVLMNQVHMDSYCIYPPCIYSLDHYYKSGTLHIGINVGKLKKCYNMKGADCQ